ncbi:hypothetical protein ACWEBX_23640 [Streptomyces sp. NPDC005070]
MSGALDRVMEALVGASEDEVTAALSAAGVSPPRPSSPAPLRTPLPGPEASLHIVSEVEWV